MRMVHAELALLTQHSKLTNVLVLNLNVIEMRSLLLMEHVSHAITPLDLAFQTENPVLKRVVPHT